MSIKIVVDSCCDLNEEIRKELNPIVVPLTIRLDDVEYKDDENLDVDLFLEKMKQSIGAPKTSCPSPQDFMDAYQGEGSVFVVTLSSALSGTYRSAMLAKELFKEQVGEKFIHVFDSLTASVGETLVSKRIGELIKKSYQEAEIVQNVNRYIAEMKTFFMIDSLDTLVKAGRISPLMAKISSILSVRPIMKGTSEGTISVQEKVVGIKKAFRRFVETIGEQGTNLEEKVLGIAHCNCLDKALEFKEEVMKRYSFKEIIIVKMAGITTTFADEGGLVIAF